MRADESILLGALNTLRTQRGDTDFHLHDFLADCMEQADTLLPEHSLWSMNGMRTRIRRRRDSFKRAERGLKKRYSLAFKEFEAALAAGEFVNGRLVSAYAEWMGEQPEEERVPLFFGSDCTVGGRQARLDVLCELLTAIGRRLRKSVPLFPEGGGTEPLLGFNVTADRVEVMWTEPDK